MVIPNDQIHYTVVDAPGPDDEARRAQIARALEGMTPYPVSDLVFDWRGAGPSLQVAVVARKPVWDGDGWLPSMGTASQIGRVFAIRRDGTDDEVVSLLVTAYGHKAAFLDRLGADGAARYVIGELERIRPAARGLLQVVAHHSWTLDPYAAGDWAYFGPGTVTQFMPAMFQPHGRVHFCGEQTAVGARGMEGAMESGERAALEVALALS